MHAYTHNQVNVHTQVHVHTHMLTYTQTYICLSTHTHWWDKPLPKILICKVQSWSCQIIWVIFQISQKTSWAGLWLIPSISCDTQHQTPARLQLIGRCHVNLPFNLEHLGDALSSILCPQWQPNGYLEYLLKNLSRAGTLILFPRLTAGWGFTGVWGWLAGKKG